MNMQNMKTLKTLLFCFFIAFVLVSSSPTTDSENVENDSEYSYDINCPHGPNHWGEINPDWILCNKGKTQSPIDLINKKAVIVSNLGKLRRVYKPANTVLVNPGHAIELIWEGNAGNIEINGTQYDLKQCHWHSPSEHTIDGKRFDLEVHLVHKSKDNRIAVVGIMYKIGQSADSFLSMLSEHIKIIANVKEKKAPVGVIDLKQLKISSSQYYRYIGSLTTPPCTEDVIWTVIRQVQPVLDEQVKLLRDAVLDEYENNARPVQPFNLRDLQLYAPPGGKRRDI